MHIYAENRTEKHIFRPKKCPEMGFFRPSEIDTFCRKMSKVPQMGLFHRPEEVPFYGHLSDMPVRAREWPTRAFEPSGKKLPTQHAKSQHRRPTRPHGRVPALVRSVSVAGGLRNALFSARRWPVLHARHTESNFTHANGRSDCRRPTRPHGRVPALVSVSVGCFINSLRCL